MESWNSRDVYLEEVVTAEARVYVGEVEVCGCRGCQSLLPDISCQLGVDDVSFTVMLGIGYASLQVTQLAHLN